jgi:branched-chain amino acid aminotransferase
MAEHPKYLWWNGEQVAWEDATVHVTDIAWSATGGVFEGIRAYWNDNQEELFVFRLQEHMQRLKNSSKMVRLPIQPTVDELVQITVDLLKANGSREDTYIFPLVYFGQAQTKRADPASLQGDLFVRTDPRPSHLGTGLEHRAKISSWTRISDNVMPPRVKNISNYRNGQLATYEVKLDGYDVALLLGADGKVTEAPGACLMFVKNGTLITPDPASGILESITRDALMTLACQELGMPVVERRVDRTELYTADEIFLCGTMAEITPIVEVDRFQVGDGTIGPVTGELEQLFIEIVRGQETKWQQWRTPVGVSS